MLLQSLASGQPMRCTSIVQFVNLQQVAMPTPVLIGDTVLRLHMFVV